MLSDNSLHTIKSAYDDITIALDQRTEYLHHPIGKKLLHIMQDKKTNLAVAADVRTQQELITLIDAVGPHICILKTHIDIIEDFEPTLLDVLKQKAHDYDFLLCEDRKFADIGSTAQAQMHGGIYHITQWADIIIAHAIAGPGIIDALRAMSAQTALLLVAQLSCKGNLIDDQYSKRVVHMAKEHHDIVIGLIGQDVTIDTSFLLKITPGINACQQTDTLNQQYNSPAYAIGTLHSDIIIVGRGIYQAHDPKRAVQDYQIQAWTAYQQRLCS